MYSSLLVLIRACIDSCNKKVFKMINMFNQVLKLTSKVFFFLAGSDELVNEIVPSSSPCEVMMKCCNKNNLLKFCEDKIPTSEPQTSRSQSLQSVGNND